MPVTDVEKSLRVLIVEDSADDAELLVHELRRGGYAVIAQRVDNRHGLSAALEQGTWDIVLSDYNMPGFNALDALRILRESRQKDLPCIIVSGCIGEASAVAALKAGASNYVMKTNLPELVPVLERELEEAQQLRSQLERKNLRLDNIKLQRQRENADRENRVKSEFLASMSHELRTPLNAIIGFSELLDQETFGPLLPRQKEFVTSVIQSGRHLLNLVNEILDLSKIEAGHAQLSREWISVPAMVEAVSGVAQSLALQQKIDLKIRVQPDLPQLCADPMRIKQVLYNLLSNAIKFTPAGGTVTLRASRSVDGVTISIEDSGIGIKQENLSRLFREFEKLEPADGLAREGTGLGLILTKRLVELHGGSIQVVSELGKGTKLTVHLPLTGTQEPSPTLHEASGLPTPASLVTHLRSAVNLADREFKHVALLVATLPQFSRSMPALWAQPLQAHIRIGDFLGQADENAIGLVAYGPPESIEKALCQRFSDLLSRTLSEPAGPVRVVWYPTDSRDPEELLKKALSAG